MSDRLMALRLFARIARTGSFSRAGRELGLSQPSASRIASELERQVGAALMTRTTRGLKLTEAGSDWQIHAYGQVGHGFTNPNASEGQMDGGFYHALAAEGSWTSFIHLLEDLFG